MQIRVLKAALAIIPFCTGQLQAASDTALLEQVLAKHQAAVEGMRSWTAEAAWEGSISGASVKALHGLETTRFDSGTALWKRDGDRLSVTKTTSARVPALNWEQELTTLTILNEECLLHCGDANTKFLSRYDTSDPKALSKFLAQKLRLSTLPHIDLYGLGTGSERLLEAYKRDGGFETWTCEKLAPESSPAYRIFRRGKEHMEMAPIEYTIDQKSFLITEVKAYEDVSASTVYIHIKVDLQQLPTGEWFPATVFEQHRDWSQTIEIKNVQARPTFQSADFSNHAIPTIDLEGWKMLRTGLDKTSALYAFDNDSWMPIAIANNGREE